ncbi:glyoxal oxidase [Phellopilus nigrolimitatus]|nr:glyoxal oxidase [Phellopilus nigrolimitatus]
MVSLNAHPSSSKLVACLVAANAAWAQSSTQASPGQPQRTGTIGTYEIVGSSIASAQQMFLGTLDKVYIVDKVENNPTQINGHPAWAAEYAVGSDTARAMDAVTNSFCAGGAVLGNGTWVNAGGNQAVTWGGLTANSQNGGAPYDDPDGGQSLRLLNPCDDGSCDWVVHSDNAMTTRRWYPSVETLADGSIFIIGGDQWGGYVNSEANNNPTYEFFPSRGAPISSPLLTTTLPANLYPITFLLPSGNLLIQLNWATAILDYNTNTEYPLDDIPDAVRTYPASAGTVMFPLTPANNWTATVMFCGGTQLQPDQWTENWNVAQYPASSSCVKISPDLSGSYQQEDALSTGRAMTSLVLLPTGKILCFNGANTGVSGYGNTSWSIGQSYADNPVMQPALFDPTAAAGSRWTNGGLSPSTIPRMYHSTVTLLPDGSVLISGSNPNADYTVGPNVKYPTEYRVERFYPSYFNERRPQPQGLLSTIGYGGPYFNVSLSSDDLFGNVNNVKNATAVVIRTGFSTHALSMGQRFVQLNSTYTGNNDGSATLHVSQMPPNPAILAPGPALLFVVVNGVPSVGVQVMIGSGQIETQKTAAAVNLPPSNLAVASSDGKSSSSGTKSSGALSFRHLVGSHGHISSWWAPAALVLCFYSQ